MGGQDPSQMNNVAAMSKILGLVAPLLFPKTQKQGFGPGPTVTKAGSIAEALPALFSGGGDIAEQYAKLQTEKNQPTMADAFKTYLEAHRQATPATSREGPQVNAPQQPIEAPEWMSKVKDFKGTDFSQYAPSGTPAIPEWKQKAEYEKGLSSEDKSAKLDYVNKLPAGPLKDYLTAEAEGFKPPTPPQAQTPLDIEEQKARIHKLNMDVQKGNSELSSDKRGAALLDKYSKVGASGMTREERNAFKLWISMKPNGEIPADLEDPKAKPDSASQSNWLGKAWNWLTGGKKEEAKGVGPKAGGPQEDWTKKPDGSWVPNENAGAGTAGEEDEEGVAQPKTTPPSVPQAPPSQTSAVPTRPPDIPVLTAPNKMQPGAKPKVPPAGFPEKPVPVLKPGESKEGFWRDGNGILRKLSGGKWVAVTESGEVMP